MIKKQTVHLRFGLILAILFAGLFFVQSTSAISSAVCPAVVSVTATSSYSSAIPSNAFDCSDATDWNAGQSTGTITAEFPAQLA